MAMALAGTPAFAQETKSPAQSTSSLPQVPTVQQVDPATGRPVDHQGERVDVVDQSVRRRYQGDTDNDTVAAYIPLPAVASDPATSSRARFFDRGLQARRLPGQTVKQIARPEYQAQGIRAGGMVVLPYLTAGLLVDSNVYAENNARSDIVFTGAAGLNARSDWGRHAFEVEGFVRRREYAKFETESTTTYRIASNGRYDLSSHAAILASASHERSVLDRSAVEEVGAQALPVRVTQTLGQLGAQIDSGPMQIDVSGNIGRSVYADNRTFAGAPVDQSFRNFDALGAELGLGFDMGGQRTVYAQFNYDRRRFDPNKTGVIRDSDSYRGLAGLRGGVTRLIRGHIGLGYIHIDFTDPTARNLNAFAVDAQLDWLVAKRTTITFQAIRDLRTVAQSNSRGALVTNLRAGVDHEVRRNLIVSAEVSHQWSDYVNDSRRARSTGVALGAVWLINQKFQLRSQASYRKRTDHGFDINAKPEDFMAGLELTYRL